MQCFQKDAMFKKAMHLQRHLSVIISKQGIEAEVTKCEMFCT